MSNKDASQFGGQDPGASVTRQDMAHALESSEFARLMLETLPAGAILADAEGGIVAVNQAAADIWRSTALPSDDWGFAARRGWSAETGAPLELKDWPLVRAVTEGKPSGAVVIDIQRFDNTLASIIDSAAPIRDDEGRIIGAIAVAQDISAERRLHLFNRALARINGAITARRTVNSVIRLAVRETVLAVGAESGVLYVNNDGAWEARWSYGLPRSMAGKRFAEEEVYHSVLAVRSDGEIIINDPDHDSHVDSDLVTRYGIKAILDVPLVVGDDLIGDFCLHHHDERKFTEEEADFARNVASSLTLALRNAKLLSDEHHVAETLQQALLFLPETLPGVELAALYRAATDASRIGGDFYDVFEIDRGAIGITIGDVSGKGIEAATQTTLIKSAIRAYAFDGNPPGVVLRKTNRLMERAFAAESFATVFYAVFTPADGRLVYCGAGHPPALVQRSDSVDLLAPTAPLLGAFPATVFPHAETVLGSSDILVLYTDGVIEAHRGTELYGMARLQQVVRDCARLQDMPDRIFDDIVAFAAEQLRDDVAILVVAPR